VCATYQARRISQTQQKTTNTKTPQEPTETHVTHWPAAPSLFSNAAATAGPYADRPLAMGMRCGSARIGTQHATSHLCCCVEGAGAGGPKCASQTAFACLPQKFSFSARQLAKHPYTPLHPHWRATNDQGLPMKSPPTSNTNPIYAKPSIQLIVWKHPLTFWASPVGPKHTWNQHARH
jgi:hypothetical protein